MATINATYKRYNGTSWDTIYFATSAAQVGESSSRFFIKSSNTVNGKAFTQNGGITLYAGDIKMSSSDATTLASKFGDYVPTTRTVNGHALSENISVTKGDLGLGNVENTAISTWAGSSNLTTYSGGTFGTAAKANVTTETTAANLKASTDLITGAKVKTLVESYGYTTNTGDVIASGTAFTNDFIMVGAGNKSIKSSAMALSTLISIAEGATNTFVVTTTGTNAVPADFKSDSDTITVSASALKDNQGNTILSSTLKVGDIFLVEETTYPDRWVKSKDVANNTVTFGLLEARKMDLSSYATKSQTVTSVDYDSTNKKIKFTRGSSTNEVMNLGIANGVITIGSSTITPLTSHQTMKYRPISVAGSSKLGDTTATALNFLNTGNVQFSYDNGLKASVDLSGYLPTSTAFIKSASVSGNTLTLTKSDNTTVSFKGTQIHYATSEPTSGINTGDVLIQYTA